MNYISKELEKDYHRIIQDSVFGLDINILLTNDGNDVNIEFLRKCGANFCICNKYEGERPPYILILDSEEPKTAEQLLSKYYGYHPNPYIGFVDEFKEYVNSGKENVSNVL